MREVRPDDHAAVLKIWSKRYRDLGRSRTQVVSRLHAVLCELIPGGIAKAITAAAAARLLESIAPAGAGEAARCELAATFAEDLRGIDARIRETRKKLAVAVQAAGTSLTGLYGVGPVVAAVVIGDVRDVSRFPGRDRFAAHNGTAPIEVSSGPRKIYRLSRRGNRRLDAIHMVAVTQIGHRHSEGRAYYDKKLAEGKTPKEALRSLKRQVSNAIFACLQAPGGPQHARGTREGRKGTTLSPARPDCTPGTGSSDKPLPGPVTTLRPQPATQRQTLLVPGAELAIPRSLPPCRQAQPQGPGGAPAAQRGQRPGGAADDGQTRPRGRPGVKDHCESHSARRAPHRLRRTPAEPLDTKRLSFCRV